MSRTVEPYRDPELPERFLRWIETLRNRISTIPCFTYSGGDPNGVIAGQKGDLYYDNVADVYYFKSTDTGNSGWVLLGGGGGGGNDLQQAYLAGTDGKIIIDGTRGSVAIQDSSPAQTPPFTLFEVLDDVGTQLFDVTTSSGDVNVGPRSPATGTVTIYHDGVPTITTFSNGISVRAGASANTGIFLQDTGGVTDASLVIGAADLTLDNRINLGRFLLQGRDSGSGTVDFLVATPEADVALFHNDVEVVQTQTAANGGLLVNNLSTGLGFERVLTASDLTSPGAQISGTPVDNELAIWIDATTIEGDASLTYDGNILQATRVNVATGGSAGSPTLRFGDGDSGFYEPADDTVRFVIAGGGRFDMVSTGIQGLSPSTFAIFTSNTSSPTNPIYSFNGDGDTGINRGGGDDTISLIAGGAELLRATEATADYIQTFGPIFIQEQGAAAADILGFGQFWVRSSDEAPMFTTESGVDFQLNATGAPGGADTQVQYNDGGVFGGDAAFTFDDATAQLTVTNTISASPALQLNLGNNPSTAIQIDSTLSTNYIVMRLNDQTGTNFFIIRHDYSPSAPNHEFIIESNLGGELMELENEGNCWFGGGEGGPFGVINTTATTQVRINDTATLLIEGRSAAAADQAGYAQLWLDDADDRPKWTPDTGVDNIIAYLSDIPAAGGQVDSVSGGTNINVTGTAVDPIVNLDAAITGVSVNGVTLSNAGAATSYLDETGNYSVPAGAGDVVAVGTPVNNQLAIWTGANSIEGDADLTFDGTQLQVGVPGGSAVTMRIGSSIGYELRPNTTTGGWARGLVVDRQSDSALVAGMGFLGAAEAVTYAAIGFGASWWATDNDFRFYDGGSMFIRERAASLADVTAFGQLWVKDDAPNRLRFTDDAGGENVLAYVSELPAAAITQLTGDVTAGPGSGSQVATIPAGTVTNTQLDDMIANTVKVRTISTGAPQDLLVGSNTVLGNFGAGISAQQVQTAQIQNLAVTYAKMQNVTGDRLLGRQPGGFGNVQEITLGTNLSLTGTTLNASGGSGPTRQISTAQTAVTNSISLVTPTGFADIALTAGTQYKVRFVGWFGSNTAGTNPGYRIRLDYTAILNLSEGRVRGYRNSGLVDSTRSNGDITTLGYNCGSNSDEALCIGEWTITTLTAGNLRLQFAQSTANATAIALAQGAYLEVIEF